MRTWSIFAFSSVFLTFFYLWSYDKGYSICKVTFKALCSCHFFYLCDDLLIFARVYFMWTVIKHIILVKCQSHISHIWGTSSTTTWLGGLWIEWCNFNLFFFGGGGEGGAPLIGAKRDLLIKKMQKVFLSLHSIVIPVELSYLWLHWVRSFGKTIKCVLNLNSCTLSNFQNNEIINKKNRKMPLKVKISKTCMCPF